MSRSILVLGAGIVGVSCALALQQRGFAVTLLDRREPGRETSYGNAGVIGRSSLVPLNNPGLYAKLPGYLGNRHPALHLDWRRALTSPGVPLGAKQKSFQAAVDKAVAWSTAEHLKREAELANGFKQQGLDVYAPDTAAFRAFAQKVYLESDEAKAWPKGMLEKINALK